MSGHPEPQAIEDSLAGTTAIPRSKSPHSSPQHPISGTGFGPIDPR